jgi:hypothetical protein
MSKRQAQCHPGQLAHLIWSGPLWTVKSEPEALTIFAFHPNADSFAANSKTAKMAAIKVDYDKTVDKEDIDLLYAQDLHFPTDVYTFAIMLEAFTNVLGILFGDSSIIHKEVQGLIKFTKDHFLEFQNLAALHHQNLSKIFYGIDLAVQNCLCILGDSEMPFGSASFDSLKMELNNLRHLISHRHTYSINLPASFTAVLKEFMEKHTTKGDDTKTKGKQKIKSVANESGNKSQTNTSFSRPNTNINPKWALPTGIDYTKAFFGADTRGKYPKHDGTPYCLNFLIMGKCTRQNCPRSHEDPRNVSQEADKEFTEFCQKQFDRCQTKKE